jgi:tagaturonate reductase
MTTTPIVQFGTSRFLQAHVDLFVSEALEAGTALGPIAVVQTSGDPERARRLSALAAPEGFPVLIRGLEAGRPVECSLRVTSVARAMTTERDMAEIERIVCHEAKILISNTSDAGFRPRPADAFPVFDQAMSFPAKIGRLLLARYAAGGASIQVMPTELVSRNGDTLKALVKTATAAMPKAFRDWIDSQVTFVNSLADRIVSAPLEPAGAVAEPYALWAIEDCPGLLLPCRNAAIEVVPSLEEVETRKLFILNLGHTYLVDNWLEGGCRGARFVRELMDDASTRRDLEDLYNLEVLPGFSAAGQGKAAADYVRVVLDRFANPFLDHALSDIAQNHEEKLERRIAAFVDWARAAGSSASMPRLARMMGRASKTAKASARRL